MDPPGLPSHIEIPTTSSPPSGDRTLSDDLQQRADELLEDALAESGARDPRDYYRDRLRDLKQADRGAYERAVHYYRDVLLPSIAEDAADPLTAWLEYGRTLAELTAPGRTLIVDRTGRAIPYQPPPAPDSLVIHIPEASRSRPLLVGLAPDLSPAQRATYDWLIAGRQKLQG